MTTFSLHRSGCFYVQQQNDHRPWRGIDQFGEISVHGVLSRVDGLRDKLRVTIDTSDRRVMIPTENRLDFAELPADVIDKLQIEFDSDPSQVAFKALPEA